MVVNAEAKQQEIAANLNEASGPLFKVRNDPRQTRCWSSPCVVTALMKFPN